MSDDSKPSIWKRLETWADANTRNRATAQAAKMDREAGKQEARALKMSKKHLRGGRRAAKAAVTAEGLRNAAERKRSAA